MKNYISEFIGTMILVFGGTAAISINTISNGTVSHLGIGIVFGLLVMSLIYAIGDVSGAHMNPAVSIAFYFSKRLKLKDMIFYIIFQFLGGLVGSIINYILFFKETDNFGMTMPRGSDMQSFILELILTFFLMFVIMGVATGAKEKGLMAGIAIGGVVALEAIFAGPICGASMNPVRSIAPAIVSMNFNSLWVYIVAPVLGAILGVVAYEFIRKEEAN